ncbi:hypothetical protein CEXT_301981 [Caerostris extrusa]|uniref:Uncharacterized protein n=1 Tax=Caerostris extrusa TaxID=172846 RepID=A0AAV4M2B5_CAEEX|nr:hypothetical protein CEXT_301981 [Caerostris extrusa]
MLSNSAKTSEFEMKIFATLVICETEKEKKRRKAEIHWKQEKLAANCVAMIKPPRGRLCNLFQQQRLNGEVTPPKLN